LPWEAGRRMSVIVYGAPSFAESRKNKGEVRNFSRKMKVIS
jgi:hypothetical protein